MQGSSQFTQASARLVDIYGKRHARSSLARVKISDTTGGHVASRRCGRWRLYQAVYSVKRSIKVRKLFMKRSRVSEKNTALSQFLSCGGGNGLSCEPGRLVCVKPVGAFQQKTVVDDRPCPQLLLHPYQSLMTN